MVFIRDRIKKMKKKFFSAEKVLSVHLSVGVYLYGYLWMDVGAERNIRWSHDLSCCRKLATVFLQLQFFSIIPHQFVPNFIFFSFSFAKIRIHITCFRITRRVCIPMLLLVLPPSPLLLFTLFVRFYSILYIPFIVWFSLPFFFSLALALYQTHTHSAPSSFHFLLYRLFFNIYSIIRSRLSSYVCYF